jgi:mono/diheme cytochrome c family protein
MKRHSMITTGVLGLALAGALVASTPASADQTTSGDEALIERGDYLVNRVGMCDDCHSPRGPDGQFIAGAHLWGSLLGFAPTVPMPAWAENALPIAGLPPGWNEEAMVEFLMTGKRPLDMPPTRPPMPQYRFSKADAVAVAAYLKSLAPKQQ